MRLRQIGRCGGERGGGRASPVGEAEAGGAPRRQVSLGTAKERPCRVASPIPRIGRRGEPSTPGFMRGCSRPGDCGDPDRLYNEGWDESGVVGIPLVWSLAMKELRCVHEVSIRWRRPAI